MNRHALVAALAVMQDKLLIVGEPEPSLVLIEQMAAGPIPRRAKPRHGDSIAQMMQRLGAAKKT